MKSAAKDRPGAAPVDGLPHSLREAMAMQEIEGNPLSPDEVALFVMFERENWPHEKRLAYLRDLALRSAGSRLPARCRVCPKETSTSVT